MHRDADRLSRRGHSPARWSQPWRCAARPRCWLIFWAAPGTASRTRRGAIAVQAGLVPISVGLVGASAIVLTRAADHSWVAVVITAATAAIAYWTRWNPLWLIGIAGLAGLTGLV